MSSIALISDIHGNLPALEAVVTDIRGQAPDAVYVLGDMTNGCRWSAEVLDSLMCFGWPMLLGNHDDAVLQLGTPRMEPRYADTQRYALLWWTRERLGRAHLDLLTSLPLEAVPTFPDAPPLRLLHGLPGNFFAGFRPDAPEAWATEQLSSVAEKTVAGGHTHVAMVRNYGSWQVINAGSVGVPYDGDTRAGYVLLTSHRAEWQVEIRRVAYDLHAVEAGYCDSGLEREGGVMGWMFMRSVLSGLPWVADFAWWLRCQSPEHIADVQEALRLYDASHGPGRWAFRV